MLRPTQSYILYDPIEDIWWRFSKGMALTGAAALREARRASSAHAFPQAIAVVGARAAMRDRNRRDMTDPDTGQGPLLGAATATRLRHRSDFEGHTA